MADTNPTQPAVNLDSVLTLLRGSLAPPAALLTRDSFAALLDIGVSTFDRLREVGKIGPRPIHLAGLKWHREEILAWVAQRGPDGELHDLKTWPIVWASLQRKIGPATH